MQHELINILIRTGFRPQLFARCLQSITDQNYPNLRVIVSIDRDCDYVPSWCDVIRVSPGNESYTYDCYLNALKEIVTDGYFFALDDDEVLAKDCLSKIIFDNPAIIHKIDYMGKIIPTRQGVFLGEIGMPSIMLHHSLKNLANFDGGNHGDYNFIKAIEAQVALYYSDLVLVRVDRKGNGV